MSKLGLMLMIVELQVSQDGVTCPVITDVVTPGWLGWLWLKCRTAFRPGREQLTVTTEMVRNAGYHLEANRSVLNALIAGSAGFNINKIRPYGERIRFVLTPTRDDIRAAIAVRETGKDPIV